MDNEKRKRPRVNLKRAPHITITVYLPERSAEHIAALAGTEGRSLSQMAAVLLAEALQKRGKA